MCRYCSHLKDLRKSDLEKFKLSERKFYLCLMRHEVLLARCLVVLSLVKPDCSLIIDVRKELEREVL